MAQPLKINFKVYQGSTFKEVFRWESSTKVYVPISGITKAAPCVVSTSVAHSMPQGWRFKVSNVLGMKEINSDSTYHTAHSVTADTININSLNSLAYSAYTSEGVIEYNQPVDLTNTTARMQIREKLESTTPILELTTENGGILIDNVLKTITIYISAADTTLLNFSAAVYSLELIKNSEVTPFLTGSVSLVKEVTR